jgi:hypothetical protein
MRLVSTTKLLLSVSVPEFPQFAPFKTVDRQAIKDFTAHFKPYSDFNYTSLYAWSSHDCEVSQLHGNLVLRMPDYITAEETITFMGNHMVVETARELINHYGALVLIPEEVALQLQALPDVRVTEDPDNHDYILSAAHHVELSGQAFANKRKNINKLRRQLGDSMRAREVDLLSADVQTAILQLTRGWRRFNTQGAADAQQEAQAIKTLLKEVDGALKDEGLRCMTIEIGHELQAFCIYEVVAGKYAVTHFGKANLEVAHLYELLMVETLRSIYHTFGVDKVNNEQDLGIAGLRANKLSHKPIEFLKKYTITPVPTSD